MNAVTRRLIAKELYVNRYPVLAGVVAGPLSIVVASLGDTGFKIGSLTWLTTLVALGVVLAMFGIMNERKERSLLFVLTLPLSVGDYLRAKMAGLALCFAIPWLASSVAALLLVLANPAVPDGLAPFVVLLCGFLLANFSVVLAATVHARSEGPMSAIIIVTNMSVSLFMFGVGALPGLHDHMFGAVPVWNRAFWTVLALELAVLVIAGSLPWIFAARRRDFI